MVRNRVKKWIFFIGVLLTSAPHFLFAAEGDLYDFLWLDPDKSVYVLQNKVYKKKNTFYANLGFIKGMTGEFQNTIGGQVSAGFYFHEEWAVDAYYHLYNNSNNEAFRNLGRINGSTPFIRRFNNMYGAGVVWSPFYGKINTFNEIFYFDWSFGLGLSSVNTESNATTVANTATADRFNDESYLGIVTKTAFRFHITQHFHINLEYVRTNYSAPGPTFNNQGGESKFRANQDLIFGVGFSF